MPPAARGFTRVQECFTFPAHELFSQFCHHPRAWGLLYVRFVMYLASIFCRYIFSGGLCFISLCEGFYAVYWYITPSALSVYRYFKLVMMKKSEVLPSEIVFDLVYIMVFAEDKKAVFDTTILMLLNVKALI